MIIWNIMALGDNKCREKISRAWCIQIQYSVYVHEQLELVGKKKINK